MYRFKLQAVLDHRQFIEDTLKKELAEIRQAVKTAEERLDMMLTKETNTADMLSYEQSQGLSSDQVVAYHAYLKRLGEQIDSQRAEIAAISERAIRKQREVLDAVKNRQILEKLKEKDIERFNMAMQKKETAFIDEIAVNRFARKKLNPGGENE